MGAKVGVLGFSGPRFWGFGFMLFRLASQWGPADGPQGDPRRHGRQGEGGAGVQGTQGFDFKSCMGGIGEASDADQGPSAASARACPEAKPRVPERPPNPAPLPRRACSLRAPRSSRRAWSTRWRAPASSWCTPTTTRRSSRTPSWRTWRCALHAVLFVVLSLMGVCACYVCGVCVFGRVALCLLPLRVLLGSGVRQESVGGGGVPGGKGGAQGRRHGGHGGARIGGEGGGALRVPALRVCVCVLLCCFVCNVCVVRGCGLAGARARVVRGCLFACFYMCVEMCGRAVVPRACASRPSTPLPCAPHLAPPPQDIFSKVDKSGEGVCVQVRRRRERLGWPYFSRSRSSPGLVVAGRGGPRATQQSPHSCIRTQAHAHTRTHSLSLSLSLTHTHTHTRTHTPPPPARRPPSGRSRRCWRSSTLTTSASRSAASTSGRCTRRTCCGPT
jgi:hypothetical protein